MSVTLLAIGLAGCHSEDPNAAAGNDKKTPAELLIGTWTLEELQIGRVGGALSGGRMPWYHSRRYEYRPDGTCVESNNQNLFRIRVQCGVLQYRIEGNTIHKAAQPAADSPHLNEPGFVQPDGLHHWESTIVELAGTRLVEEYLQGQERWVSTYRRVR